jgi:hypothetical protein
MANKNLAQIRRHVVKHLSGLGYVAVDRSVWRFGNADQGWVFALWSARKFRGWSTGGFELGFVSAPRGLWEALAPITVGSRVVAGKPGSAIGVPIWRDPIRRRPGLGVERRFDPDLRGGDGPWWVYAVDGDLDPELLTDLDDFVAEAHELGLRLHDVGALVEYVGPPRNLPPVKSGLCLTVAVATEHDHRLRSVFDEAVDRLVELGGLSSGVEREQAEVRRLHRKRLGLREDEAPGRS